MNQTDSIRVMIVDDHPIVRRGLAFSLALYDDLQVVGEAGDGQEAVRLCEELRPQVVLMDMVMPVMDGIAATRAIHHRHPEVSILVLTSFQDPQLVRNALRAGAVGFMLKDVSIDDLADAIRAASIGQATLTDAVAQALLETDSGTEHKLDKLTERQKQILALVVDGLTNQEIAKRLFVSVPTVRFHVSTILSKLHAANRAEAAGIAVKHHLLD